MAKSGQNLSHVFYLHLGPMHVTINRCRHHMQQENLKPFKMFPLTMFCLQKWILHQPKISSEQSNRITRLPDTQSQANILQKLVNIDDKVCVELSYKQHKRKPQTKGYFWHGTQETLQGNIVSRIKLLFRYMHCCRDVKIWQILYHYK
jgi:hypothetical protein